MIDKDILARDVVRYQGEPVAAVAAGAADNTAGSAHGVDYGHYSVRLIHLLLTVPVIRLHPAIRVAASAPEKEQRLDLLRQAVVGRVARAEQLRGQALI